MAENISSCCSGNFSPNKEKFNQNFVLTTINTVVGKVPSIYSKVSFKDRLEHFKCRVTNLRDNYKIESGIYALGNPGKDSDIFVTANYKFSFDSLRSKLKGIDCWILVLNTNGINVWCAAGKGTFGTKELISKIKNEKIDKLVDHRRIILPQYGAVGVAAHEVKEKTGFKVIYGPIRAEDIKKFINKGYSASKTMRTSKFGLTNRVALIPLEFNNYLSQFFCISFFVLIFFGLKSNGVLYNPMLFHGVPVIIAGFLSYCIGSVGIPVLLPYIPFRSFALKGGLLGLIVPLILTFISSLEIFNNLYIIIFSWLTFPAVSSFSALQFTGSTTFTNHSGVKKELKFALPVYILIIVVSIVLLFLFKKYTWYPGGLY